MGASTLLNILLIVLIIWFVYRRFAPTKGLRNLGAKDFENGMAESPSRILLDVREPQEYKRGYIPGAKNIPLSQLHGRLEEIPKEKDVFLYCQSGMRSKNAARVLLKNGYSNLSQLQGGIGTWKGKISK